MPAAADQLSVRTAVTTVARTPFGSLVAFVLVKFSFSFYSFSLLSCTRRAHRGPTVQQCNSEKILKIGHYLAKLGTRVWCLVFYWTTV